MKGIGLKIIIFLCQKHCNHLNEHMSPKFRLFLILLFVMKCDVCTLFSSFSVSIICEARMITVKFGSIRKDLVGKFVQILYLPGKPGNSFFMILNHEVSKESYLFPNEMTVNYWYDIIKLYFSIPELIDLPCTLLWWSENSSTLVWFYQVQSQSLLYLCQSI